jgi:hypothetical protein
MRPCKAFIRSRMGYGAFLFNKLKKLLQKLEWIKYMAICGPLGYRSSTLTDMVLAKAKAIPIFSRFKQLGRNYMSTCYTSSNPMVQLLEELAILVNNPGRGENEQPLIGKYYKEVTPLGHLIQSGNCPLAFNYIYESLIYKARLSFNEGRQMKEIEDHSEELKFSIKNKNQ